MDYINIIWDFKGKILVFQPFFINESTPKTLLYMKMSEKFKIEKEGKIFRRRSHSYVEERFCPMTKILDFAAICNKKRFSEWTHQLVIVNFTRDKSMRANLKK